ncbi:MAG: hypothetical protein HY432_03015 [Candidatus Liptonbacteria bacterium]|nr:hypothetical protein [Candidatus Liptonbacteria bacterium]
MSSASLFWLPVHHFCLFKKPQTPSATSAAAAIIAETIGSIIAEKGEYIRTVNNDKDIRITENNQHVTGGSLPDSYRAAIRILLGD